MYIYVYKYTCNKLDKPSKATLVEKPLQRQNDSMLYENKKEKEDVVAAEENVSEDFFVFVGK